MKTEVKKIDSIKRELNIEVTGEIVKNKLEDVYKKIAQEARVKGFRPGHIPRDILEKNYASLAQEQALKELIPDIYSQAIEKEGLQVIGLSEISDVKLQAHTLSFKACVELSPQIELKDYRGIKINSEKISVTAEEVKLSLDALKESRKKEIISDIFARELGYPNLADLERVLEAQLFLQKDNQRRKRLKAGIISHITKDLDFKLPPTLVERQLEDLVREAKLDLALKGVPKERLAEQENELRKNLELQAKEQVKIYLVLAAIAKNENIPQGEDMSDKVMEFLLREADWQE